jgi:hypothetical protein
MKPTMASINRSAKKSGQTDMSTKAPGFIAQKPGDIGRLLTPGLLREMDISMVESPSKMVIRNPMEIMRTRSMKPAAKKAASRMALAEAKIPAKAFEARLRATLREKVWFYFF